MDSRPVFLVFQRFGFAAVLGFLTLLTACGAGTTGNNPTAPSWQYTAMGDSLADGLIAQEGYVPRYATYVNLDTGANVTTTNLGVPGWHSGDLLNAIQTDQHFKDEITSAQ